MDYITLINKAIAARENAYAPYSHFKVGAAVLMESGKIYTGCNVENSSYGATNCAERSAIFKAASEGERKIIALAVAGNDCDYIYPCGICRQVIGEFCTDNTEMIMIKNKNDYKTVKFKELMPYMFDKGRL